MTNAADKNLEIIKHELNFARRQAGHIEGANSNDYNIADEIQMAMDSALNALADYLLSLQPACDEIPEGVRLPEAA